MVPAASPPTVREVEAPGTPLLGPPLNGVVGWFELFLETLHDFLRSEEALLGVTLNRLSV